MQTHRNRRSVGLLGGIIASVVLPVTAAHGQAIDEDYYQPGEQFGKGDYCYTEVLTEEEMEARVGNDLYCFETEDERDSAESVAFGYGSPDGGLSTLSFGYQRLARHYDSISATGSNLSVSGTSCTGGGTSLVGGSWDNRISSTVHGACYEIRHYATGDYTGTPQTTTGPCYAPRGMFVGWNDDVSSIKYFGPEDGSCNLA